MSNLFRKAAGPLILVGAAQFVVGMMLAEALYPGYSVANNTISALGVGPSAVIFNPSVFLFGLMAAAGSYCLWRAFRVKLVAVLIIVAGIGAMGVGAFPSNTGVLHDVVSFMAFFFGGLSAIAAFRLEKATLNYISVIMGLLALIALVLYATNNSLGLGRGGIERMVAYPIIFWAVAFGGYLIALEDKKP